MNKRYDGCPSGLCALCRLWSKELELDHRMPWFLGGEHDLSNIQWLCLECHRKKTAEGQGTLSAIGWKGKRYGQPRPPHRNPSGMCATCGSVYEHLELDHQHPIFLGGIHDISNIQWLCHGCHSEKTKSEKRGKKASDSTRKAMQQGQQAYWENHPEMRETTAEQMKAHWENPEYRANLEQHRKSLSNNASFKAKVGTVTKARWQTPEGRERFTQNIRETWQNPISREKLLTSRREHPHHARPYPSIIGPDGTVYPPGNNLKQFCLEHAVGNYKSFQGAVIGKRRTYQGWRLAETT